MKVTLCSLLQFLCLIPATILPCHSFASSNETPDYAEGFLKFQQMTGITTQSMAYVNISDTWPYDIDSVLPYPKETSGNAWMVSEEIDDEGHPINGIFIVNGAERVKISGKRFAPSSDTADSVHSITGTREIYGKWREVDYHRDIKKIMRFFEWLDHERFPDIYLKSDNIARIFMFAFHINQQGESEYANLIIGRLFKRAGNEKTVRHALTYTASCEYENLYRQFASDHDWDAYSLGIQHLLDSYGKAWKAYEAMEDLQSRVASVALYRSKHRSDTLDSENADNTKAIDPGDIRFIHSKRRHQSDGVLWLLPETWTPGSVITPEDIDLAIRMRGMSAIPLLLESTKDGRLTDADASRVRVDSFQYRFSYSRQSRFPEIFRDLNRPATRREIATRILYELLKESALGQRTELSEADVIGSATDFHSDHKRDSTDHIALLYVRQNDEFDRTFQAALKVMILNSKETRLPALEHLVMEEDLDNEYGMYDSAPQNEANTKARVLARYAALRDDGRRELVEKLAQSIATIAKEYRRPENHTFGSPEANEQHEIETRDKTRAVTERLRNTRFDLPITTMLSQIPALNEDRTTYEKDVLMIRLLSMKTASAVKLLLDEAVRSPTNRIAVADFITSFMYEVDLGLVGKADYRKLGCTPSDNAEAWKALISDETPVPDSDLCVADRFLLINEQMFSFMGQAVQRKHSSHTRNRLSRLTSKSTPALTVIRQYGKQGRQLLIKRVMDRLDGKDEKSLPEFPSATIVSTAPREYLQSTLTSLSSREAAEKAVDNFDVTTLAAMPVFLLENSTINEDLTHFANTIVSVNAQSDDNNTDQFQQWKGKALKPEMLRALKDFCMQKTREGIPVVCTVTRQRNFGGCNIVVAPLEKKDEEQQDPGKTTQLAGMTGLVCGHDLYAAASWRTAPPPSTQRWMALSTSEPDSIRTFEAKLDKFCGHKAPACAAGLVKFQGKEMRDED